MCKKLSPFFSLDCWLVSSQQFYLDEICTMYFNHNFCLPCCQRESAMVTDFFEGRAPSKLLQVILFLSLFTLLPPSRKKLWPCRVLSAAPHFGEWIAVVNTAWKKIRKRNQIWITANPFYKELLTWLKQDSRTLIFKSYCFSLWVDEIITNLLFYHYRFLNGL